MNSQDYAQLANDLLSLAKEIEDSKRAGYTQGDVDVLKNFKSVGEKVKTTCPQCGSGHSIGSGAAWGVYALKHIDAILTSLTQPHLPQAEPIKGRFADAVNYLKLGFSLQQDIEKALIKPTPNVDVSGNVMHGP